MAFSCHEKAGEYWTLQLGETSKLKWVEKNFLRILSGMELETDEKSQSWVWWEESQQADVSINATKLTQQ